MSNPKYVVIGAGNAGAITIAKLIAQGHETTLISPNDNTSLIDAIPSSKEFNEKCLNFKSIKNFEHKSKFHK